LSPARSLYGFVSPGIGISAAKIPHIFDAFAQVQDGQATGTGLGLFGVRTRAEGLGGSCGARHNTASSTGTGTILWFAIPYIPDSPNSPAASGRTLAFGSPSSQVIPFTGAPTESPSEDLRKVFSTDLSVGSDPYLVPSPDDPNQRTADFIRRKQLTAILVEDTLTVRKLMEKLLLNMGFARVDCYENGSKGLDAMMAGQVDIVFSDVQMPIMTGPEVRAVVTIHSTRRYLPLHYFRCSPDGQPVPDVRGCRAGLGITHCAAAGGGRNRQRRAERADRCARLRRGVPQAPAPQRHL
jgi:hypothetical protein